MSKLFSDQTVIVPDSTVETYDAFGRFRTSTPLALFSDRGYVSNNKLWDVSTSGGGNLNDTNASFEGGIRLEVGTASGDEIIRQTRQRFIYEPARSAFISNSISFHTPQANLRQRVGFFDTNDGFYLQINGTNDPEFVIRNGTSGSATETTISQSNWNLDKFDGTGPSGVDINFDEGLVFIIDFTWHGNGIIRFGFLIDGRPVYAHKEDLSVNNGSIFPYMGNPTLPIRLELTNTGTTSAASTLFWKASSVASEGNKTDQGVVVSTVSGEKSIGTSLVPILSVRLDPNLTNTNGEILSYGFVNLDNKPAAVEVYYNPTLTGASWTSINNLAQQDSSATALSGGILISAFFVRDDGVAEIPVNFNERGLGFAIDGTPDIITVAARSYSFSADVEAAITLIERY